MKKIAFFVQHMICGGVENALIALTQELVKENDITIYVIDMAGEFLEYVPKQVHLKQIELPDAVRRTLPVGGIKLALKKALKQKQYGAACALVKNKLLYRTGFAELDIAFDCISPMAEQYDIAVNYHMHSPFLVRYLCEKVTAPVKYTWIHNDFYTTQYDIKALSQYLACNDAFFGVSKQVADEFVAILPQEKEKTSVAHNIVPADGVKAKAELFYPSEFSAVQNGLKILSVGRLEDQKGYDIAIEAANMLQQKGLEFTWFILGEGSERAALEALVKKYNLSERVRFLGIRKNPYPYFKHCDIYAQTSKHEGWGLTITEAKIFALPIVTTDFAGAKEQLENEINGFVVEISAQAVVQKLEVLLNDPAVRARFAQALQENNAAQEMNLTMFA